MFFSIPSVSFYFTQQKLTNCQTDPSFLWPSVVSSSQIVFLTIPICTALQHFGGKWVISLFAYHFILYIQQSLLFSQLHNCIPCKMPPSEEFHVNNVSNIECLRLGFPSARNFVWLSLIPPKHRFKMFQDLWVKIWSFLTSSFQSIIKYPTTQKSQELHIFHFRRCPITPESKHLMLAFHSAM